MARVRVRRRVSMTLRAVMRWAIPPALVLVMLPGTWSVADTFDGAGSGRGLEQSWQEYRTFGEHDNPWKVVQSEAVRRSGHNPVNSEVVALLDEAPRGADQQVSITVNALEVTPTDRPSWASVGVLARSTAESGEDGVAKELSGYNGEIVLTDEFGRLEYLLLLWLVDDWDFGDAPEDVAVLASHSLGTSVDFPVRLTVRAQGTAITVFVVQDDGSTAFVRVTDSALANGRVGMISSLVAPVSAEIEADDFLATTPRSGP